MHEEIFMSSWFREDGKEKGERRLEKGKETEEESGKKRRREEGKRRELNGEC